LLAAVGSREQGLDSLRKRFAYGREEAIHRLQNLKERKQNVIKTT
jgi:hypothetical protein